MDINQIDYMIDKVNCSRTKKNALFTFKSGMKRVMILCEDDELVRIGDRLFLDAFNVSVDDLESITLVPKLNN